MKDCDHKWQPMIYDFWRNSFDGVVRTDYGESPSCMVVIELFCTSCYAKLRTGVKPSSKEADYQFDYAPSMVASAEKKKKPTPKLTKKEGK